MLLTEPEPEGRNTVRYLRRSTVLALVVAVGLAAGAAAFAAKPKAGTTYEGDGVTAKIGRDPNGIKKIVTRTETGKYVVRDLTIKKGKFKTQIFGGTGFDPIFVIKGKFSTSRKAVGFYTTPLATGETRYDFTLTPR